MLQILPTFASPTRSPQRGEPAKLPSPPARHRVVLLLLPGVLMLDLAAPTHLFGHCGSAHYALELAAERPGPVVTSTGIEVHAGSGLDQLTGADTVVVPGYASHLEPPSPELLAALAAAFGNGARMLSICTGAFALAHAGILDGRRAATHWDAAEDLAQRFPGVSVDPTVLYCDTGQVLTSAGVASGLDLCLHVIRRDLGAAVASGYARRTVIAPHRDGGQAQFIPHPIRLPPEPAGVGSLEPTRAWALSKLEQPLDVARLASHACVSPRTFARRFRAETGTTPGRWLQDQRALAAQQLLETTDLPVEQVAQRVGYGSPAALRQHLHRVAQTTPSAYRRSFRVADQVGGLRVSIVASTDPASASTS